MPPKKYSLLFSINCIVKSFTPTPFGRIHPYSIPARVDHSGSSINFISTINLTAFILDEFKINMYTLNLPGLKCLKINFKDITNTLISAETIRNKINRNTTCNLEFNCLTIRINKDNDSPHLGIFEVCLLFNIGDCFIQKLFSEINKNIKKNNPFFTETLNRDISHNLRRLITS